MLVLGRCDCILMRYSDKFRPCTRRCVLTNDNVSITRTTSTVIFSAPPTECEAQKKAIERIYSKNYIAFDRCK